MRVRGKAGRAVGVVGVGAWIAAACSGGGSDGGSGARRRRHRSWMQGARVARRASMLGRSIRYVYEVAELAPGRVLDMRAVEGPFAMATRYEFEDAGEGRTRVRIRNRGGPGGPLRLLDPLMGRVVRRQVGKDLGRLKVILEA